MPLCSSMYSKNTRIDGKVVVITGCNTGIGKETARDLFVRGAKILMAVRNVEKGEQAKQEIMESSKGAEGVGSLEVLQLDLSSLQSVRNFASGVDSSVNKIDILINNAGIMACPRNETSDGFESQLGVNHLGHFLLTLLLLPRIRAAAPSRIINLSSMAHKFGRIHFDNLMLNERYTPFAAYSQSKLANILFTRKLANLLEGTGVSVYAVHPGVVRTELARHMPTWQKILLKPIMVLSKSPVKGAQTSIYCAVEPGLAEQTGRYYADCAEHTLGRAATSEEDAQKLWSLSEELTGEKFSPP